MTARAGVTDDAVAGIPHYREGDSDEESSIRFQADRARFLVRAYRQVGPIFRAWVEGRMWVVLGGPEANDFVWRSTEVWDFPHVFPAFLEQMGPDHLNVLEGDGHRHKRTILKPAFDQAPAMRYLPQFNDWFHRELEGANGTGPVELIEFWAETITKANTRTVSQVELSPAALKRLVKWEREMLAGIFMGDARRAYYARQEYVALRAEAMALMERMVDERLADPGRYGDNFSAVLSARSKQEGGFPDRQFLVDDLYYILVAGVENTSRLINWSALHCWLAPEWLARLREEIDAWDGLDVMALGRMTTLKAVIMETQRLHPPSIFLPRHAARDFEFGGHRVPAGADILNASALCHFLDEIYEDAFSFQPERFVESGRFAPRTNGFFGGGVHICLGRNHTLMQTPVALAQMVKHHDLAYVDTAMLRDHLGAPGRAIPAEILAEVRPRRA